MDILKIRTYNTFLSIGNSLYKVFTFSENNMGKPKAEETPGEEEEKPKPPPPDPKHLPAKLIKCVRKVETL